MKRSCMAGVAGVPQLAAVRHLAALPPHAPGRAPAALREGRPGVPVCALPARHVPHGRLAVHVAVWRAGDGCASLNDVM